MRSVPLAVATILVIMSPAHAQQTPNTSDAAIELTVPSSPAFAILGLSPENVARPATLREFAASILNGVDANGNLQTGVAIDTSPYLLIAGDQLTIRAYIDEPLKRWLARTQLSLATAKGASDDDKAFRFAVGVHLTPWDAGDPRLLTSLLECLTRIPFPPLPTIPPGSSDEQIKKILAEYEATKTKQPFQREMADACRASAKPQLWNRSRWALGVAAAWISEDGDLGDVGWDGAAAWTSLILGQDIWERFMPPAAARISQLILHARYRDSERVPNPLGEGPFIEQDSLVLGTRVRLGNDKLGVNLEGAFVREDRQSGGDDDYIRYSVGVEFRLAANLWIQVGVGGTSGRSGKEEAFALSAINWGMSPERTIGAAP